MNEILEACLIIAANLCISTKASIETDDTAMWAGARIQLAAVKIVSTMRTDNFPYPDRRRMNKLCSSEANCVYYHRHCSTKPDIVQCVISYNVDGDEFNKSIRISGSKECEIESALENVALLIPSIPNLIPLSKLSAESPSETPPHCRPQKDAECVQ
jgi:hypothetical protein